MPILKKGTLDPFLPYHVLCACVRALTQKRGEGTPISTDAEGNNDTAGSSVILGAAKNEAVRAISSSLLPLPLLRLFEREGEEKRRDRSMLLLLPRGKNHRCCCCCDLPSPLPLPKRYCPSSGASSLFATGCRDVDGEATDFLAAPRQRTDDPSLPSLPLLYLVSLVSCCFDVA